MADPLGDELTSAAANGDLQQLITLLGKNANVSAKNRFQRTALQVMKLGRPEVATLLLVNGADPNVKDKTGFAIIHDAAREGFLDTMRVLLQFKADVNIEDDEGNLPLHLAAREGHLHVVEFLLGHTESNTGHRNKTGDTAYDLAKLYKREDIVQWMEANLTIGPGSQIN